MGGYRQKIWTTFAHHADWTFLIARTEPGSVAHAGLSYLLVPLDQAQVEVRPIRTLVGDSGFCEVFYEGARTPASNVVGTVGDGWRTAMSTLGHERATSVLGYQFAFEHELDALLRVAKRRQKLAQPLLRQRLAEAVSGLHILRWNTTRMLTQVMTGGDFGPEASIGKLYWSSWHERVTELGLDSLGGDGVAEVEGDDERPLQRAFLRARAEPSTPVPRRSRGTSLPNGSSASLGSHAPPPLLPRAHRDPPPPAPGRDRGARPVRWRVRSVLRPAAPLARGASWPG